MGSLLNAVRQLSSKYPIYTFQRVRTCARFIGMDSPISVKTMIENIASPPPALDYKLYLDLHPNVRNAITWQHDGQVIPYEYWGSHQTTNVLQQNVQMIPLKEWGENKAISIFDICNYVLATFYDSISRGLSVPFEFNADPNQDVAPIPGVAPGLYWSKWFSEFDALQIYLAHVAQSFWVEMTRKVPWHLHDFSDSDLALILGSTSMFVECPFPEPWAKGLYDVNYDCSGRGTPGDSTKSFRFLTGTGKDIRLGQSMIKSTIPETIFELFRWIRDHLCHGDVIIGGDKGLMTYGYEGPAPIEKIFTRVEQIPPGYEAPESRYWDWDGCHGAVALVVWLMRTVNIPCSGHGTFIEDSENPAHHGIDFPDEQLFSAHTDDFCANPEVLDPTIEPIEIFEPRENYQTMKQLLLTAPNGVPRYKPCRQAMFRKGLNHPCYFWVQLYWFDLIHGTHQLDTVLLGSPPKYPAFDESDLPALHAQYDSKLQAVVDAYIQQHDLQNVSPKDALARYTADYKSWDDNR